jgi:hypothetical protein
MHSLSAAVRGGNAVARPIPHGGSLTFPAKQKAKTASFSHSPTRPPQAPAAPFKRAYRKRPGDATLTPSSGLRAPGRFR